MEVMLKGKIAKGGKTKKDPNMSWYSVLCPGANDSTDVVMLMSPNEYKNGQEISIKGDGRLEFVREAIPAKKF